VPPPEAGEEAGTAEMQRFTGFVASSLWLISGKRDILIRQKSFFY